MRSGCEHSTPNLLTDDYLHFSGNNVNLTEEAAAIFNPEPAYAGISFCGTVYTFTPLDEGTPHSGYFEWILTTI
jgi:hypothetical protein